MSRITISITRCERCDPHFAWRDERTDKTDRTSLRHIADETDSRFPGHHRSQNFLKLRQRRDTVEDDPCAGNIERRIGKGEQTCALQYVRFVIAGNFGAYLPDE